MSNIPTLEQLWDLVGNPDAYSVQHEDGAYYPVRQPITDELLEAHLRQEITIGTYIGHVVDGRTVAKTLCLDVDSGDYGEAERLVAALNSLGVPATSVGVEESGRKGYHVWVPLAESVPNADLRRLGRATLLLAGVDCEVYPKQDEVRDLGNLVKLPGSIHRVSGKLASFLSAIPVPVQRRSWERVIEGLPAEQGRSKGSSPVRYKCMEEIQNEGVTEGSRNIQLFHLATMLRRAGVVDTNVERIIHAANELGDPLDDAEVEALLESSKSSGPICGQLPGSRHCGEACVTQRTAGLSTRTGQLRWAGAGEKVVVQIKDRHGNIVELEHPDTERIKGVLG